MEIVLKDYYLYRSLGKLSDILKGFEEAREFKRERGSKVGAFQYGLQEAVSNCIEIEYTSMAEKILEKELGITVDNLKESHLFVDRDRRHIDKLRILCGLGVNHLYSDNYVRAKRYFTELKEILEQSLSVGNEYFELNSQLEALKALRNRDEEGVKEIEQKIEKIEQSYEVLPFYKWFTPDSDWDRCLQYFIEFLNKEVKLRSKEDEIHDILSETIDKCEDMIKCLEIPFKKGIYKDSDTISIHGSSVEIARKDDAEKKLKEILEAFGRLIDFCGKKRVR
jgi:tetratricopeptide (TPR) repeat protein